MKLFLVFGVIFLCQCSPATEHAATYLMHSSGLYLAKGKNNVAILSYAEAARADVKPFLFDTQEDGSNNIVLQQDSNALYLGLGTKDGWTTFFLHEKTDKYTQYVIEETGGKYVKLRNLQTGKYLDRRKPPERYGLFGQIRHRRKSFMGVYGQTGKTATD